ncbi:MAG: UDP-3-O-(3-hydroxymyristoyl)glucosamine N-acyltransferase [Planctomycetaceae bacterium]
MGQTSNRQALPRGEWTAGDIADRIQATLIGNRRLCLEGVEIVERATDRQLTFVGDAKNLLRLKASAAAAVIAPSALSAEISAWPNTTFLLVAEPEVAFLQAAELFFPRRAKPAAAIAKSAHVAESALIGNNARIGHGAVIGEHVVIGDNCDIGAGVVIGDGCRLGNNATLHPNVVLYSDVILGDDVTIHAACVIGADGFGYRQVNGRHERLPHFGIVRICDDVEIGAGTTIDRAKVGETVIGSGTKIDNQVMIGHNCRIGRHNLLVSQVGFAGSCTTGDYVVCAGQAGIADHVHLGDGAIIGAKAGVHRDMPGGQAYLGSPAAPVSETTRQLMALKRLPDMRSTLKALEKDVQQLRQQLDRQNTSDTSIPGAA